MQYEPGNFTTHPRTGPQNQSPDEDKGSKWERWSKKRVFVRWRSKALPSERLNKGTDEQPRVYSSRQSTWKAARRLTGKGTSIPPPAPPNIPRRRSRTHTRVYAPGDYGQSTAISIARSSTCSQGPGGTTTVPWTGAALSEWKAGRGRHERGMRAACIKLSNGTIPDNEAILLCFKGGSHAFLFHATSCSEDRSYPPQRRTTGPPRGLRAAEGICSRRKMWTLRQRNGDPFRRSCPAKGGQFQSRHGAGAKGWSPAFAGGIDESEFWRN